MPYTTVIQCAVSSTLTFLTEQLPDATTFLHFRHLIEENRSGEKIFADVKAGLEKAGLMMHSGMIINATIIAALSPIKNKDSKRDPEMHQTQKATNGIME